MTPPQTLFASPPVVQHAGPQGFTVSIQVTRLCTGAVEWGTRPDALDHTAIAAHHGLIDTDDCCLVIPVTFPERIHDGRPVYYRVVGRPIDYASAYDISRGPIEATAVRQLRRPHAKMDRVKLAFINDTHGRAETTAALADRIASIDPDLLICNGDLCNYFDRREDVAWLLLRPGAAGDHPSDGGWASTRPMLYVPGNHDIRGQAAQHLPAVFAPGPLPQFPYNTAMRLGPVALLTMDTGEDKPDDHPSFGGTAAYEPYRKQQATWLADQLDHPDIADAPFKLAVCHIPLRGRPGDNDGTTHEGYAAYSGFSAQHWLPLLIQHRINAIISGHLHDWRIDPPTDQQPITQVVGGGPALDQAAVIVIEAAASQMDLRIEDVNGSTLASQTWAAESTD